MTSVVVCASRYTGKERDAESGLDYFGARYYGGALGRFSSPDKPFADQHPANPQTWNLYLYTRNNPLRFIDDNGEEVKETRDIVYYSVSGATASEAWTNANQHFAGGYAGNTKYEMNYTYSYEPMVSSNKGDVTVTQTVTSDIITLNQTVGLPKWEGYDKVSPEEQKAWDQGSGQLQSHEKEHEEINRAGADALDKALPGTAASATGKKVDPTAKEAVSNLRSKIADKSNANQQQTYQKNQHLDACTNHGTQACK